MDGGETLLFVAAQEEEEKKKHLLVVRYLVEQGADKRKVTNNGVTPMGAARLYGQDDVVAYLLSVGCT
jgi:ankyrin repeat protein